MSRSLHSRTLLAATLVLAAFLGMTGLVLDRAFRDSAEAALRDRLQGYVFTLLAGAELDARGLLRGPENLHEARFNQLASGLYADILQRDNKPSWRSPSAVGVEIPPTPKPKMGAGSFDKVHLEDGTPIYVLSFRILWEEGLRKPRQYTFRVAEILDGFYGQVSQFRHSLWGWLGGAAILLLAVQGMILRWGLAPLRRVAEDLAAIEAGRTAHLTGPYPRELRGLTDNLNALLDSAESHLRRYRDALGDLAHSLKTPLAVVRGALEQQTPDAEVRQLTQDQIGRMTQIIDYQLQRAATSGRTHLMPAVDVAEKAQRVKAALLKVYAEKRVVCQFDIDTRVEFRGDEGDLLEILGNLLDNAFKWCRSRVRMSARMISEPEMAQVLLELRVDDDGPGISKDVVDQVMRRGEKADPSTPGHGLGLAIVESIVGAYRGHLAIQASPLGGAAVVVRI